MDRQRAQLLPVPYFHVVFTLPHALNGLIRANTRLLYGLLFDTAAQTLQVFANNPRWLGGELGFTLVLHTWSQTLTHHPHVHGLVTGGALATDGSWKPAKRGFLFPVQALSRVFRGKYLDALNTLREDNALHWPDDLARYTHRVAISNERLLGIEDRHVSFRYRPPHGSATHEKKIMCLTHEEFLRRFLWHVLPPGFKRIRHYGLTANRNKAAKLARCRTHLNAPAPTLAPRESAAAFLLRVTGRDPTLCRHCHTGQLILIRHLPRPIRLPELHATGPPAVP